MKRRDPSQQLEFLLAEVVRLQLRIYNQRFRTTGLNQSQVSVLIHLDRTDALSQTDLARRVGIQKAAMGTLLDGLEGKQLIERSRAPEDRRVVRVSITEAGRDIVADVDEMAEPLGHSLRKGTSRRERAQLISTLQRIRENLHQMERGEPL